MKTARYLTLISFLCTSWVFADSIIELNYLEGAEAINSIRPLLQKNEQVSYLDNKLILQASPARTRTLQLLIQKLDQKPQSLQIEVMQDNNAIRQSDHLSASGQYGSITIGKTPPSHMATHTNRIKIHAGTQYSQNNSRSSQTLRLLSGAEGFIYSGSERPLRFAIVDEYGNIQYSDQAITGFYIRPRLIGQRVMIDIKAGSSAFNQNQKESTEVSTRVEGQLDSWIEIAQQSTNQQGQTILILGKKTQNQSSSDSIKVRITAD